MKTIKDVFVNFQKGLAGVYEVNEIEAITLLAITEITHLSKATIKAFPEREILGEQALQLQNILNELQTGKPIQYILGYTEFYGLNFLVNPAVLIPRPETEELVEWVIGSVDNRQWSLGNETCNLLDIGTGSGCIAISLKKNLTNAQVSAIDISPEALETAKKNAKLNEVDVNFMQVDILNFESKVEDSKYQVIVSNPPYVTGRDKEQMHINVTNFEPHTALFVSEDDPLLFYRVIANFALNNLADNGLLFFEINESYGQETADLLLDKGFKNVELKKDMSDRYRMIKAVKSKL